MCQVAGLAQSAEDRLMQSTMKGTNGLPDTAAIEHQAAADATKKVRVCPARSIQSDAVRDTTFIR